MATRTTRKHYNSPIHRAAKRVAKRRTFCDECGRPSNKLEVDHRTPLARGGETKPGNLHFLCKRCHTIKTVQENRKPSSPDRAAWARLVETRTCTEFSTPMEASCLHQTN